MPCRDLDQETVACQGDRGDQRVTMLLTDRSRERWRLPLAPIRAAQDHQITADAPSVQALTALEGPPEPPPTPAPAAPR